MPKMMIVSVTDVISGSCDNRGMKKRVIEGVKTRTKMFGIPHSVRDKEHILTDL